MWEALIIYHSGKLLSSCIFSKTLRKGSAEYITNKIVHSEQSEGLADYVRRIMNESRLSYRDIEEKALKTGHFISNGYVSKIVSGAAQNISVEKLRALAAGLNRPEEEVFAVARVRNTRSPLVQLRACLEYLGDRLVRSIEYDDLIEFKRRRSARITTRGRPPALATVHRELERLHAVFRICRPSIISAWRLKRRRNWISTEKRGQDNTSTQYYLVIK